MVGVGLAFICLLQAAEGTVTDEDFQSLVAENQHLRERLDLQQKQMDDLSARLEGLLDSKSSGPAAVPLPPPPEPIPEPVYAPSPVASQIHLSGSAGVGFFSGGSDSAFPQGEFRVDEARLFLEAQIIRNTYLFAEINLRTRESPDDNVDLGEIYVEFEDLGDRDRLFNLRVGRLDIPFGEEYQNRDVMQNPLITHSLPDIWGIDEGIEIFGQSGSVSYVLAVQNGSHDPIHDFTDDKAVTAKIGWDPARWLHFSGSLMRTGDLDVSKERLSEVWIGNGFFRSVGSTATTSFQADLGEVDARVSWNEGEAAVAWGRARYRDDDPENDNDRTIDFAQARVVQNIAGDWYAAIRYSLIHAKDGYPLPGLGSFGKYFFSPLMTRDLWRLGVGIGYRPTENLVMKFEYTLEEGTLSNGAARGNSDLVSTLVGLSF